MRAHLVVGVWLAENFFSCGFYLFLNFVYFLFFKFFYHVPNVLSANFDFFAFR